MSTAVAEPRESWLTRNIPVDSIRVDGKNVSGRTDGPEFDEFCEDVKQHGVLQAILVRAAGAEKWHLIAGHRRLAAAKKAGFEEIPAVVSTLGAEHDEELRLVENLHRRDLHPLDEALGFERLLGAGAITGAQVARIAQRVGRSARYIYDRVKLVGLIDDARELFRAGRIELGHAIILGRLSAKDQARAIDPYSRALFEHEQTLFDADADEDELPEIDHWHGLKTRTAVELQAWVDQNVRADAGAVDPMLFPVTAEELAAAKKVIPITRSYHLQDGAKSKERTFGPRAWKRADGQKGSKTCELSATGFVVAGLGRNESFAVCVQKEKCAVHWSAEIKEKAKRAKARAKEGEPWRGRSVPARDEELLQAESDAEDAAREEVAGMVFEATKGLTEIQFLRALVRSRTWLVDQYLRHLSKKQFTNKNAAEKWVEQADVEGLRAVLIFSALQNDDDVAESLGIDEAAIIKAHVAKAVAELKAKRAAAAKEAPKPPKGERVRKRGAK